MRIYLIDDDEVSNFLFRGILAKVTTGIDLRAFLNGREALEALESGDNDGYPEIMFVDLSMPIMDGWELLDELEQRYPDLSSKCKIYILTSSIREADEAKSKEHPQVTGFLQKPLTHEALLPILPNSSLGTE